MRYPPNPHSFDCQDDLDDALAMFSRAYEAELEQADDNNGGDE